LSAWDKKVALQMLTLHDSQAHEKLLFLMHYALPMAELHMMIIDSF
jgi:hypothetical protein